MGGAAGRPPPPTQAGGGEEPGGRIVYESVVVDGSPAADGGGDGPPRENLYATPNKSAAVPKPAQVSYTQVDFEAGAAASTLAPPAARRKPRASSGYVNDAVVQEFVGGGKPRTKGKPYVNLPSEGL